MNKFEVVGYWWIPDNPSNKLSGTLTFNPNDGAKLTLLGSFLDYKQGMQMMGTWGNVYRPEIIHGLAEGSKKFTLYGCDLLGSTMSGITTCAFRPSIVLEGSHCETIDEPIFAEMTIQLSHIEDWYQITGKKLELEEPGSTRPTARFTYQPPEVHSLTCTTGTIEIGHSWKVEIPRPSVDFTVSEKVGITIRPKDPVGLTEFIYDLLPVMHNLIAFCVGRPISISAVFSKITNFEREENNKNQEESRPLNLYWESKRFGDEDKELHPHDMVCTYQDMRDDFDCHIEKWITAHRELEPVMQLFFGDVLRRDSFSANRFINSVQAAEAYHRYRREGADEEEKVHEQRISSIVESSPEVHRSWLKTKLRYSNEKGLRKRLKELFTEQADLCSLSTKEIKEIVHNIANARNAFTHHAGKDSSNFAGGIELYVYSELIRWILTAFLLEELGIERKRAHELLCRSQDFLYFREVNLKKRIVPVMTVTDIPEEDLPGEDKPS